MLRLKAILEERGEKVYFCDLTREDLSFAVANAFRCDKTVFAACTYDGGLFPPMEHFLSRLKAKNFQSRTAAVVENGSWALSAGKLMRAALEGMKNVNVKCELSIPSALHGEETLQNFAKELLN